MSKSFQALRTIIINYSDSLTLADLTQSVSKLGFEVAMTMSNLPEMTRSVQSLKPDLVLVELQTSETDLFETLKQVVSWRTSAVVGLLNEWDIDLALKSMDVGVSGFLYKPFDVRQIRAVLECAWHHFQTIKTLQDALTLRRLLEQAKGVLMEQQHISEEKAHQTILKMSQDQGISLKELCCSILQVKAIIGEEKIMGN